MWNYSKRGLNGSPTWLLVTLSRRGLIPYSLILCLLFLVRLALLGLKIVPARVIVSGPKSLTKLLIF
jgi:hypothetical protein